MRRLPLVLLSAVAVAGFAASAAASSATTGRPAHTSSAASSAQLTLITEPEAGVAPVLSAITGAKHQVDMVMYEDSDTQVNAALVADAKRGVRSEEHTS